MALTERNLPREFDELKADMKSIMDQVSALSGKLGESVSETAGSVPAGLRQAVAATAEQTGALGKRAQDFAGEIEKRGNTGLNTLSGCVQNYPIASIVIAFGLGLLVAKVLDRSPS
ncbi:MAG TPA: hypothetical protein VJ770_08320 [Stellaceae bacterium]|nr:hypothetical protein [Stellaceae bacterium]